jgi:hypothetical protein
MIIAQPQPSSDVAALPVERCVLARRGWVGETSGLFEQPAGVAGAVHEFLQSYVSSCQNGFSIPC